ncbi:ABC transporter ATP-binding protein [soil metagenome]
MPIIDIQNLHKAFGPKKVFSGLNLSVEKGESHVVIGRSGEGKSVLLKHITGLLVQDAGEVIINGMNMRTDKEALKWVRQNVAMVFQMAALFDSLTVYENVAFFHLESRQKSGAELERMVAELLELVDLPNTEHLYPSELSGGMRKRVGLARALACEPQIILYDEPTTGLDPVTSEVINQLMIRARDRSNTTSIVITHDMQSAYSVADRISMLYEGRIIFNGTPEEVQSSDDPVVHQFVNGLAEGPITAEEGEMMKSRVSMVIDRSKISL